MYVTNTLLTILSRILIMGIGMVIGIIVARFLGPSDKGILATLAAITGITCQIGTLGLSAANTHYAAKRKDWVSSLISMSLKWSLVVGLLLSTAILSIYSFFPFIFKGIDHSLLFISVMLIPATIGLILMLSLLMGLEKFKQYNLFELYYSFVLLSVFIVLIAVFKFGLFSIVLAQSIIPWLYFVILIVYLSFHKPQLQNTSFPLLKRSLSYGFNIWIAVLLNYLVLRLDMIIVNYYCGGEGAGWYSVAVSAGDLLLIIPIAVGQTLFPRLSALLHEGRENAFIRLHQTFWLPYLGFCLGFGLIFPYFVRLLYGPAFLMAVPAFFALLPGIFFIGLQIVISNNLSAREIMKYFPHIWGVGFIFNFVLSIMLVKSYGFVGAAVASSLSYFLIFLMMLAYHLRHSQVKARQLFIPKLENYHLVIHESMEFLRQLFRRSTINADDK